MKLSIAIVILLTGFGLRAEDAKAPAKSETVDSKESKKMTTKDAKISCKEMGKTGSDLIQCMKDKKEK